MNYDGTPRDFLTIEVIKKYKVIIIIIITSEVFMTRVQPTYLHKKVLKHYTTYYNTATYKL